MKYVSVLCLEFVTIVVALTSSHLFVLDVLLYMNTFSDTIWLIDSSCTYICLYITIHMLVFISSMIQPRQADSSKPRGTPLAPDVTRNVQMWSAVPVSL